MDPKQFLNKLHKNLVTLKEDHCKELETLEKVAPPGREDQVKELKGKVNNPYAVSWASYNKTHNKSKGKKISKGTAPTENAGGVAGINPVYGDSDGGVSMSLSEKSKMKKEEKKSNAYLTNEERSSEEDSAVEHDIKAARDGNPNPDEANKGILPGDKEAVERTVTDPSNGPLKKDDVHVAKAKSNFTMPKMPKLPKMPKKGLMSSITTMTAGPQAGAGVPGGAGAAASKAEAKMPGGTHSTEGVKLVGSKIPPLHPGAKKLPMPGMSMPKMGKDEWKPGKMLGGSAPSVHLAGVGTKMPKPVTGVKTMAERVAAKVPMKKEELGFDKLKNKLAHQKGVTDPAALAAKIGRDKFGAKGMAEKAKAGKMKKSEDTFDLGSCLFCGYPEHLGSCK